MGTIPQSIPSEANHGALPSYASYLKSGHWTLIKRQSSSIYGGKCVVCGSQHALNFHHLFYPEKHDEILGHQVIPLCEPCHKAYHLAAPSRGVNAVPSSLSEAEKIVSSTFSLIKAKRRLVTNDSVWNQQLANREQKTKKTFRNREQNKKTSKRG